MSSNSQAVDRVVLNAVATGSATFSLRAGAARQQGLHHHISWATGVTAGTIIIECADSATFAGTWAPIATIAWSAASPSQDYAYTPGQPKAIRHRITVAVTGGAAPSVTTRIVGVPA